MILYNNYLKCPPYENDPLYGITPPPPVTQRMQRLEDLEKQLSDLETKRSVLTDKIAEAQVGREESDERTQLLKQLEAGKEEKKQLAAELESHRTCDPERIKELRGETVVAKEAANRWTGEYTQYK